jgi:long-chain acyl-CoA synthetase
MSETLAKMVLRQAEHLGPQAALREKADGSYSDISWQAMADNILLFARGLRALGIKEKDRVAIMAPNCPEWVYADVGTLSCAAISVPVYHTEGIDTLKHIVNDSGSRVLFIASQLLAKDVAEQWGELTGLEKVILLDGRLDHPNILSLAEFKGLAESVPDGEIKQLLDSGTGDDLATLVYTSGTTGVPKGAMLTHNNILSNIEACSQLYDIRESDTCLSFLPLSHIFERMAGYYFMLSKGVTIAYAENIDSVPLNLTEIQPHIVISVPRLYEKMFARVMERVLAGPWVRKQIFFTALKIGQAHVARLVANQPDPALLKIGLAIASKLVFSKLHERLGGSLRFFISGGAPLVQNVAEFFLAAGIPIYEGYGLTETSPVLAANNADAIRLGTVGKPVSGTKIKIADDGEIIVAGPGIFQGYWQKDDKTAEVLADGWFKTGDIGEIDTDGFLKITDRKKDLIVTAGGKNIAPQFLENLFKTDKYLSNAVVYGDRKPFLTALLVPNFDNIEKYARYKKIDFLNHCDLVNHPRVLDLVRRRIDKMQSGQPSFNRVKRFTLISRDFTAEEGEITPTLKIKRKEVSANFQQILEGMYLAEGHGNHDAGFCVIEHES